MKDGGTEHFSQRIEKILDGNLKPYPGSTSACHPADLPAAMTRIEDAKSPIAWLQAMADNTKAPKQLILLEHVAFTAEVSWDSSTSGNVINKVHAQALFIEGVTVEDVLTGGTAEAGRCQYLRVDFDPGNLGRIFPDPMVHAHSAPKGEPRFPASVSSSLPHVDFIELILRNYARDIWESWANRVWERRIQPNQGTVEDPRMAIRSAFQGGQHKTLRDHLREPVELWKKKLIEEKRKMSPLRYETSFETLNY